MDRRGAATRKKMVMFFLIDGSGSMDVGNKMGALNDSMRNAIEIAQDLDVNNTDVQIEVALMLFGTGNDGMQCKWLYGEPEPVDRFEYVDQVASGWTPMAKALNMLNDAMSRTKFLDTPSGSVAPVVVVMSDGIPCTINGTEESDYSETYSAITALNNNGWFVNAIKAAIAIGDDADRALLAKITGDPNTVFDVHDAGALKEVIKFIVVRSSVINTRMAGASSQSSDPQKAFAEESKVEKEEIEEDDDFNSVGWVTQ